MPDRRGKPQAVAGAPPIRRNRKRRSHPSSTAIATSAAIVAAGRAHSTGAIPGSASSMASASRAGGIRPARAADPCPTGATIAASVTAHSRPAVAAPTIAATASGGGNATIAPVRSSTTSPSPSVP